MVRVTTSNYGADATTQFAWATVGSDQFSREDDLYNLAQAVEHHTHAATRGLAVARVATGAVDAAAIAGLAVGTTALANLSVTNAKLAAGAVTMDKITIPLVQATDNFVGGFRLRDSTNTYQVGHYIAANGLAVFGAGPVAGISTANLILGQAGQVSVGTAQGAAKFNVMQAANGVGSGFRIYNSNTSFYVDCWSDDTATIHFNNTGATNSLFLSPTTGNVTIGATSEGSAKLTLLQASQSSNEGWACLRGVGAGRGYVLDIGDFVLASAGTSVKLEHGSANFAPVTTGGATLGRAGLAWGAATVAALTATTGTFSGAVSMAGLTATTGTFSGAVSAASYSGVINATTGTFSGAVSMAGLTATTGTFSGAVSAASFSTAGGVTAAAVSASGGDGSFGTVHIFSATGGFYLVVGNDAVAKPAGGSWQAGSDVRGKDHIRPYDHGLAELRQLQPVYYQYNGRYGWPAHQRDYVGMVAQDVLPHVPEMVLTNHGAIDPDDPESPTEDYLVTDPGVLDYLLITSVKELADRVEALEAKSLVTH